VVVFPFTSPSAKKFSQDNRNRKSISWYLNHARPHNNNYFFINYINLKKHPYDFEIVSWKKAIALCLARSRKDK
jgi:hypothetical protein